tara:strand:- start:543 stop:1211 length:669 start_codon:yes stop_codon:yes gene_type:complete
MKYYAVIHGVCGLYEGYSDTTCDWFPTEEAAQKHVKQCLDTYREDEMCVNIDHSGDMMHTFVTMDRDPDNYAACVPSDMDHDDYVAEHGDDVSVEVFRIVEVDKPYRSDTTESVWLTWDQQDCSVAWDYYPLCMSLVARVSSDVLDTTNDDYPTQSLHNLAQLGEFISAVYYRKEAFIDIDDYTMHAFRIPKKLEMRCNECGYVDDAVASHYEECSKLKTDA